MKCAIKYCEHEKYRILPTTDGVYIPLCFNHYYKGYKEVLPTVIQEIRSRDVTGKFQKYLCHKPVDNEYKIRLAKNSKKIAKDIEL